MDSEADTVWVWGSNDDDQLGLQDAPGINSVPTELELPGTLAVSGGYSHSITLRSDGSVWSWGDNDLAQLGTRDPGANEAIPAQVLGLDGIVAVSTKSAHTLALKADGTVWAWGYSAWGPLGNGTSGGSVSEPAPVINLGNAIAVSAGNQFSLQRQNAVG
jgi:alpha-tubulin suppressor-like RCC1 family protein